MLEPKEFIEVLGLEVEFTEGESKEELVEKIKKAAGNKFIDKSLLEVEKQNAIAGLARKVGSAEVKMRQVFGDEYRGKNFDELVESLPSVFENKVNELKNELAEIKKNKGSKEESDKVQKELDETRELLKRANADIEAEREKAKSELSAKEQEHQAWKEGLELGLIYDSLNWVDGTKKHTKDGLFNNEIKSKYAFKKVDGTFMAYKEDGVTPETGGTTSHLTAEELFNIILKKEELLKVNGATGSKEAGGQKVDLSGVSNPFVKSNLEKAMAHAERQKKA